VYLRFVYIVIYSLIFLFSILFLSVVFLFDELKHLRELSLDCGSDGNREYAPGDQVKQGGLPVVEDKHNDDGSDDSDQVPDDHSDKVVLGR